MNAQEQAESAIEQAVIQTVMTFQQASALTMNKIISEAAQCRNLEEFVVRVKVAQDKLLALPPEKSYVVEAKAETSR